MGDKPARLGKTPTPAEPMALWYSLDRPSGTEVAARFTAAGLPISTGPSRWKKSGWLGVANAPRTDRPIPAEAQAIWDSLEQPSLHQVADAFKAQGRPVDPATIRNWKQAGWSDVTAQNAVAKANRPSRKSPRPFLPSPAMPHPLCPIF